MANVKLEVPGGLPRLTLQTRTGLATRGEDCWAASAVTLIRFMSRNRVGPKDPSEWAKWIKLVRKWANRPTGGGSLRTHLAVALRHKDLAAMFSKAGLTAPRVAVKSGVLWDDLKDLVRDGSRMAVLGVNNRVLAEHAPGMVGFPSFKGGHAVVMTRIGDVGDQMCTIEGDPGFDGRASRIPRGWQTVKSWPLNRAAAAFGDHRAEGGKNNSWGPGKAEAVVVGRSALKAKPKPPVEEPPVQNEPDPPTPVVDLAAEAAILRGVADRLEAKA